MFPGSRRYMATYRGPSSAPLTPDWAGGASFVSSSSPDANSTSPCTEMPPEGSPGPVMWPDWIPLAPAGPAHNPSATSATGTTSHFRIAHLLGLRSPLIHREWQGGSGGPSFGDRNQRIDSAMPRARSLVQEHS